MQALRLAIGLSNQLLGVQAQRPGFCAAVHRKPVSNRLVLRSKRGDDFFETRIATEWVPDGTQLQLSVVN